jgi:putative phosphoribosyl transferase
MDAGPVLEIEERAVQIRTGTVTLDGDLVLPPTPKGIVVFAHGSGSSRHSPRNRFVAKTLQDAGLATLLLDLLTGDEEMIDRLTAHIRFDVRLLADRLVGATDWVLAQPELASLRIGYFGSSTGAAAALIAATRRPQSISAVVSRGGRPDLAGTSLSWVKAPTLLIVGGDDTVVIGMNEGARTQMRTETNMVVVPGATHLFEEPGALEQVADLARDWFVRYLATGEQAA